MRHGRAIVRAARCFNHAVVVRDWLRERSRADDLNGQPLLAYSYWLGDATLGAVMARDAIPSLSVISRAHRGDLYEYHRTPPYQPFRRAILSGVDAVYAVSDDGADYLRSQHADLAERIRVSRLGVVDPVVCSSPSADGIFRIVSCSFLVPVKRVDLIIRALAQLAVMEPGRRIEWNHLGAGPLEGRLRELAARSLPTNVDAQFRGMLPNREVIRFFQETPVDIFVNVSESEGVPVSIMEAQSCAIPVLATAVGGTPEIVTPEDGYLVSPDANPTMIAQVLRRHMLSTEEEITGKRESSRRTWTERYDAAVNYSAFLREIRDLMVAGSVAATSTYPD